MSMEEEELVYSFTTDPVWLSDALQFVGDGLLLNFSKLSDISEGKKLPERFTIVMELSEHNQDEDEAIPTYSSPMLSTRTEELNDDENSAPAKAWTTSLTVSLDSTPSKGSNLDAAENTVVKYNSIDLTALASPKEVTNIVEECNELDLDSMSKTNQTKLADEHKSEIESKTSSHQAESAETTGEASMKPIKRTESVLKREIRRQEEREQEVLKERERAMRQLRRHQLTEESKQRTESLKHSQQSLLASIHKDVNANQTSATDSAEDMDDRSKTVIMNNNTPVKGPSSPRTETLEYIQQDINDRLSQPSQIRRSSALSKSDYYKYYKSALNAS